MTDAPTLDDVFAVMAAASVGDTEARVALPAEPDMVDPASRVGVALNMLLDDLTQRTSDLHESEERLRQAQKMDAIGRLAGGVAHDFNNILTAVVGFGSILAESLPEGADRDLAGQIVEAGERAAALTRQLLALGRRQVMTPQVIEPAEVVAGLAPLIERIIGEHIEFRAIRPADSLHVRADPSQLEQVLVNLVANARDAMPSGGKLIVEVAEAEFHSLSTSTNPEVEPGPHVLITVSDTGSGMSDEVREHVFEPFYTTKGELGSTGLGLSTVYGVVKQSGGSIGVYSEPGRGATFKVYLPRVFETPEPRPMRISESEFRAATETILLAEDDQVVRGVALLALSRAGYHVLTADGGPTALRVAADHAGQIDLLVTDVVMPEMSGRQLADQLRRIRPDLPVLYMSGYTETTIVHHGVLDPEVDFLAKPFTPTALVTKVQDLLAPPAAGAAGG